MNFWDSVKAAIVATTNKFVAHQNCELHGRTHRRAHNVVFGFEKPETLKGFRILGYKATACTICGHCVKVTELLRKLPPSMDAALGGESDVVERADKGEGMIDGDGVTDVSADESISAVGTVKPAVGDSQA